MIEIALVVIVVVGVACALAIRTFVRWGSRWGATSAECDLEMPGDKYLADGPRARLVMTRAISIAAPPETVWPWLAQLGRGAGWYSYDRLDNGGTVSAQHIVSWIPEPRLGDATPIGYLRRLEPGKTLVWWLPGLRFAGSWARLVVDIGLRRLAGAAPPGQHERSKGHSRLVIRVSADAEGRLAAVALTVFGVIDTIMSRRQLLGIRDRAEHHGARATDPDRPETGARDQFQLYEAIYAAGDRAGVAGKELAVVWRNKAIEDELIENSPPAQSIAKQ